MSHMNPIQPKPEKPGRLLLDDARRKNLIFLFFNLILALVSFVMAIVNLCTAKWGILIVALLFGGACVANVFLLRKGKTWKRVAYFLFLAEGVILCGFLCISGMPEGFSAIWACLIPSFALTLLGTRKGSIYSAVGFLLMVLLFWTPFGRGLLQYPYTDSFLLRFPMSYLAFYLMALFSELLRAEMHRQLLRTEKQYQYLYNHDALTGLYNRYGFHERFQQIFSQSKGTLAFYILDIDSFKAVNDKYGHDGGDVVLRHIAGIVSRMAGETTAVSRWGGEEFTVLEWDAQDPVTFAERLRRELENAEVPLSGKDSVHITVSIGLCVVRDRENVLISDIIKCADRMLYRAKDEGKNRVVCTRL